MWKSRDPLTTFTTYMRHRQMLTDEILLEVDQRVVKEIDEAVAFAESSPDPDPSEAATDMLA
jgi:pyruvate dehydrogenase E1 component alpha subunit